MNTLEGKKILLTGGTGSFGHAFVETLLEQYNPQTIRIYSRNEKNQVDMKRNFCNDKRLKHLLNQLD